MIALDIETMPDMSKIDDLPEPEVAIGNLKDPEKIAAKRAEAKAEQVSKMALDPLFGKVISFAIAGEIEPSTVPVWCDTDEVALLSTLFGHLTRHHSHNPEICTWNGNGFDFPFIYKRALMLGIDLLAMGVPPLSYWTRRYSVAPHCDLMQVWSNWGTGHHRLNTVAKAVLGEEKIGVDVHTFPELMKTEGGRHSIAEYNYNDAELTYKLYRSFRSFLI